LTKTLEQENAMEKFIQKYKDGIAGVVSGFDRLVFRGSLRRLNFGRWDPQLAAMVAKGMEEYLWQNGVLFKEYAAHVKTVSERVKAESLRAFREQKRPILFLRSASADKEALARRVAAEQGIHSGLVCAISSLEPSPTFEHRGTHIIRRARPCHVLYHYQIHPEVGWMHARIQTWFPFNIQIAINGREWLVRQMDREGLAYCQQGNCLVWLQDYQRAQVLLAEQLRTKWVELLESVASQLNPIRESIFERYPSDYYWIAYQSEWATDVVFRDGDFLRRLMPLLVRRGVLSFSSADVMRYFGRKVNQSGVIPANFSGKLQTDLKRRQEGQRVKYWLNGNSAKFYDKAYSALGSVLRAAETTLNTVTDFRVYRPKEGGPEDDLQWRPMRKGIADLNRRAEVSQKANDRLMDALASVDDTRSVEELTREIQQPAQWRNRRVRALRPWADDRELLVAINHGDFLINGFRNRDLQRLLYDGEAASPAERKKRSAAISRKLRLLRAHGLIHKVSRTHRYHVNDSARAILVAVLTTAQTSVHQLNQLVNAA
jgi:hypothetical protein